MHEVKDVAIESARRARHWLRVRNARIILCGVVLLVAASLIVRQFSPNSAVVECAFRISKSGALPRTKGDAFRVDQCVQLEVAATNSARTLGLSRRHSLPRDRGMLFDFGQAGEYCMRTKDIGFALDMLWLNEEKEIVYMIENVTPGTYLRPFCGPKEASYVVEVHAGVVKAGDLRVGQQLRF